MMELYAVRLKEDQQPVGFFWARNFDDLLWGVDMICDPAYCEYKRINKSAAIVWEGDIDAWKMGVENNDRDENADPPIANRGASFEAAFDEFVLGTDTVKGWRDCITTTDGSFPERAFGKTYRDSFATD